jgi:hypothetical protein
VKTDEFSCKARKGSAVRNRYSFAVILVLLGLGLAACGGGDGDGEEAAPTPAGQPSPAAAETPAAEPTITGNLLEFQDRGYSVEFPEGWTPRPNFLPGPSLTIDAFFGPEEIQGIQPNIAISCEKLPEDTTLQEYFDSKVDIVRQVAEVEPEVGSSEVNGQEGLWSRFEREEADPPLAKTEIVFLTERCGWSIAMTVPLGGATDYQEIFDEFVDSFRLLP